MRATLSRIVILMVSLLLWAGALRGEEAMTGTETKPALRLSIAPADSASFSWNQIPLRIIFENVSSQPVRLLRRFKPIPVFFSISMVAQDGTPVSIPAAGKIDFTEGTIKYLQLEPHEIFGFQFDLTEIIPSGQEIKAGMYTIKATYHNQYGEDCFHTRLDSRPIMITISNSNEQP